MPALARLHEVGKLPNAFSHQSFPANAVFRVDHFLRLETVHNVLGLRFANRVFEQLWNRDHVERVEIVWDESLTLEGRASYYDQAGALKDMLQNHLPSSSAPRTGSWVVKRKTAQDRLSRALTKIAQWCRLNRHQPIAEQPTPSVPCSPQEQSGTTGVQGQTGSA